MVRAARVGRTVLADYDVIVFPNGNYGGVVGSGLVSRLQQWMRDGGTLITMGSSTRWAALESVGLLAATVERKGGRAEGSEPQHQKPRNNLSTTSKPSNLRTRAPNPFRAQSFEPFWIRTTGSPPEQMGKSACLRKQT